MKRQTFSLLLFFLCVFQYITAQTDLPTDYLSPAFHESRRQALRELLPEQSVAVIFSYPVRKFSNDVDYIYHANPDMYYFTGYREPHAVLLIFKESQTSTTGDNYKELFFVQERNEQAERWTGRRLGAEGVRKQLGIQNVYTGEEFADFPINFSAIKKVVTPGFPDDVADSRWDKADLFDLIQQFKTKSNYKETDHKQFDKNLFFHLTGQLREIKTPEELVLIRKAVEISCMGQNEVMKAVKPGMSELEIQGLHEFVHKKYGAEAVGYGSIVGSGENGCILHYMENTRTRVGNDLILMDVGAQYHGYTADVTRTIPANGTFSAEERAIYQLVYNAQEAAFEILKDGASFSEASDAAKEVIADGLLKLNIIKNKEDVSKYYPHGLLHHIGLDVHDRNFSKTMKQGMVITIEPGIYIPSDSDCDKKWWGIAVRIEDDVLIRKNDYELLSIYSPRKIEDIEKMIAQISALDDFVLPPLKSGEKKAF
ncbi:MAG: aminopeptidase P N-terminal domain-containing protein [Chitinophagaceae bacterium]|nr:aminopeptidase P N-terminal domain-containing protein [Chitinophagaceae bacterium]